MEGTRRRRGGSRLCRSATGWRGGLLASLRRAQRMGETAEAESGSRECREKKAPRAAGVVVGGVSAA
jgi:hypothetical protein